MWTYGDAVLPERYRGRRIGWCDVWRRDAAGRNAYANHVSGLHFVVDLNSMELLEVEDTGAVDPPPVMGEYVPEQVPGLAQRERPEAAGDHPAGRGVLHPGRLRAALAALADADRVQLPRGPGAALRRLRGPGQGPIRRTPDVLRRDGGALPRPDRRPLPAHRVRHRRVGPRLHDHVAGAGLRLPWRDPLPGRGAARQPRRAVPDPQRGVHPRGGRRRPLEARGPAGGGGAAGAGGWWCPRTSPWPTTSTCSTGASTRTATSSARCAPPG